MKTKYLFRILLALIVSVFAASFLLPAENGGYVMTSMRVACGVAIVVTIVLHRAVIKHLESITNGFNLLKAQDFEAGSLMWVNTTRTSSLTCLISSGRR